VIAPLVACIMAGLGLAGRGVKRDHHGLVWVGMALFTISVWALLIALAVSGAASAF
jgi:hypothetical protein